MDETQIEKPGAQNIEPISGLYDRVRAILDEGRSRVARSVNTEMVRAYWLIGEAIVQHEQGGQQRADYGARLIESLAERLKADKIKGFTLSNLKYSGSLAGGYKRKL